MRAVSYSRVSTEEQAMHGFSLDAQEEKNIQYIQDHGWEFVGSYVDPGKSGKDLNRPDIQKLLQDVEDGKIDVIVVHKLDRLTRNIGDLHFLINLFDKKGIQLHSITEKLDTSNAMGRMFVYILGIFAQWYRENLAEEVVKGQLIKHKQGKRVALGHIYGYDVVDGKLKVNPVEAEYVRRIFELYVYKGYGYDKLCQYLNKHTVSKTGRAWVPSTVKGMLQNVTYIGKNSWKPKNAPEEERIITDGDHEPILDEELFNMAQKQMERRRKLEMSRSSYHYPFSSIIKCGECGASYVSHNTVKRRNDRKAYTNYRCLNRKGKKCTASDIAELKFTKMFFAYFRKLKFKKGIYTPEENRTDQDVEKRKRAIEQEIKKQEQRRMNLGMDLADRVIDRDTYRELVSQINATIEELSASLEEIQVQEEKEETASPEEIMKFIEELEENWDYMPNEDRKFIIKMMIKKITIKKIDGEWKILDVEFV